MDKNCSLYRKVKIKEEVVFRNLQGEGVLLNLQTGTYYGLDSIGTRIWDLIEKYGSLQKVLDKLLEENDVTKEQCTKDLADFVLLLKENKLIE